MKISTSLIIFFLSIITLVFELILYFIIGMGAAFAGEASSIINIASFFLYLMITTISIGVICPIIAIIQKMNNVKVVKKKGKKRKSLKLGFFEISFK